MGRRGEKVVAGVQGGMCMVANSRRERHRFAKWLSPGDFQGGTSPYITGNYLDLTWAGNSLNRVQIKIRGISTNLKETQLSEEFPLWD